MTPEQLAAIVVDAGALEPHMEAIATAFYRTLFAQRPDLEGLFQPGSADREAAFASRLRELLGALGNTELLVERAAALGARHVRYGVRSSDYDAAGDALLAAIERAVDEPLTPERADAWRHAIRLITESMLQGARPERSERRRQFVSPW
jgi:nitric oxide dioxygenase